MNPPFFLEVQTIFWQIPFIQPIFNEGCLRSMIVESFNQSVFLGTVGGFLNYEKCFLGLIGKS